MVGQEDVIDQDEGMVFYSPTVFDKNPYYGVSVPILVVDLVELIQESKRICRRCYDGTYRGLFYKNHPLNRITVMGMIVGCRYKRIGDDDYLFMQLDDCSGSGIFLQCKCLEPLAVGNGVSCGSVSGQKMKISGIFNLWYCELEVEWIEIVPSDIVVEIEHWQYAIEYRRKLRVPWAEPVSPKPYSNYIQQMHTANVVESVVITSSYEEEVASQPSSSPSSPSPPSPLPSPLPEVTCNVTELKLEFLRGLLKYQDKSAHTIELYNSLSALLSQLATLKFLNQSVNLPVKSWQLFKTESFYNQLHKLQRSGLLRCYSNDNLVDLKPLKDLHEYSKHRILTLIKLQCRTGRIDYKHIRDKLKHSDLTKKAIIDIFKESLRSVCCSYPQLLMSWWIDVASSEYSVIHFKYENQVKCKIR